MADRFEELRTFVTIVDAGGVNAAASRLGMAKSVPSRRLSELEARLGVTLVERTTRKFELTDTGRTFHREARRILDELDRVERSAAGLQEEGGALVIAADPAIAVHILAEPLAAFQRSRPAVRATLHTAGGLDRWDLAIIGKAATGARELARFQRRVVAAPSYVEEAGTPTTLSQIETHRGILIASRDDDWRFGRGAAARPAIALEVDNELIAMAAALSGAGLAHLPSYVCDPAIEAGTLIALMPEHDVDDGLIVATRAPDAAVGTDGLLDHLAVSLRD